MEKAREKLWTKEFVLVFAIMILSSLVFYCQNNGVPLYVKDTSGSTVVAGTLSSIMVFGSMTGRIIGGRLTDIKGRRTMMLFGSGMYIITIIMPAFIPSITFLFAIRIFQGAFFGCMNTASPSAIADIIPRSRMGEGFGYAGLSQGFGLALGPALGIWLYNSAGGHRALFLACGAIIAAVFIMAWNVKYESRMPRREPAQSGATQKGIVAFIKNLVEKGSFPPAIAMSVYLLASAVTVSFLSLYANESGVSPAPFFTAQAAGVLITRATAGKLVDKYNPRFIIVPAAVVGAVGFSLMTFPPNPVLFAAAGCLYGSSLGVTSPLLHTVAVRRAPQSRYGAANATFQIFSDLGIASGSILWGKVVEVTGAYTVLFACGAVCMLVGGGVLGFFLLREGKQGAVSAPAE